MMRERYQKKERKGGKIWQKKRHAYLFVAEEEEEEVRRRAVHVDDANANDDAMFAFLFFLVLFSFLFVLCCPTSSLM